MIFFENSYSADTRDQIEDRIHRRGQTGEYVLYVDMSGSDLDRRIVKALQRKDALYQSVFRKLRSAAPIDSDVIEREMTAMKKLLPNRGAPRLRSTAMPAAARLQITLQSGASTFSCFDGQLSCDQSGGANNLLIVDQTVGGVLVQLALTQSISGAVNPASFSCLRRTSSTRAEFRLRSGCWAATLTSWVRFTPSTTSGSLTFNQNIGAPASDAVVLR